MIWIVYVAISVAVIVLASHQAYWRGRREELERLIPEIERWRREYSMKCLENYDLRMECCRLRFLAVEEEVVQDVRKVQ